MSEGTIIRFGLRNKKTKKLVGFYISANPHNGDCTENQVILREDEDDPWLVPNKYMAEMARLRDTSWFNSGHDTPTHPSGWKPDDWETVEVVIQTKVEASDVRVPTIEEYFTIKYKEKDPRHYEYMMRLLSDPVKRNRPEYSYHELVMLIHEGGWGDRQDLNE